MSGSFLFLTSSGMSTPELGEAFVKILDKKPADCRILVLGLAANADEQFYLESSKYEMVNLGFVDVALVNLHDAIEPRSLGDFSVVYVCGGNTFAILEALRRGGWEKYVKSQAERGAVYVGVSAGSIIAGPDVEIAGWGSEADPNDVGLSDLSGFCLTNIAVFPHFKEERREEVEEFRRRAIYPVRELRDGEALYVAGALRRLVGAHTVVQ